MIKKKTNAESVRGKYLETLLSAIISMLAGMAFAYMIVTNL